MIMVKDGGCDVNRITQLVNNYVPDAKLESNMAAELSYVLPSESSPNFEAMFANLEQNKTQLGILSFGASVTTMEEVFLK